MKSFFLIVEVLSYLFAFYILIKKKELAIVYLPVLVFCNIVIDASFSAFIYYGTVSAIILYSIIRNWNFYQNNIYAILLFIYFLILLPGSSDLVLIRPHIFSVLWLFASIPLISSIYQKYTEDEIFKEVSTCAFIILLLFIANVIVSTIFKYSPNEMYGITSGILYGNLYGAGFNILGIAVFILVLLSLDSKKMLYMIVLVISISFILLSLRRSVMLISILGLVIALITTVSFKDAKKLIGFSCVILMIGYTIYNFTGFTNQFKERYELRKLDERELEEEKRFFEYDLIYKDMFVYNEYSPFTGYELLNSWGHYGKGILEDRSLHADLPSITHSSGLIGLFLYLMMVITSFKQSFKSITTNLDKLIILFSAITFVVFTITGRYTESGFMLLLYLVLLLPLAKSTGPKYEEGSLAVT